MALKEQALPGKNQYRLIKTKKGETQATVRVKVEDGKITFLEWNEVVLKREGGEDTTLEAPKKFVFTKSDPEMVEAVGQLFIKAASLA